MEQGAVFSLPFGFYADDSCFAVVVEGYVGLAFGIQLEIGVPVECAAVVLLPLCRRIAAVVRVIEVFLIGEAVEDVAAVAVGDAATFIGQTAEIHGDGWLIGLCETLIAFIARRVVCVDIHFVEVIEVVVGIKILK